MTEIILASQSPRRSEILADMGVTFTVIPSEFEEHLDESRDPQTVAKELALGKARWVAQTHPDAYVIGADCIVAIGDRQMEKAHDVEDAREMLVALTKGPSIVTSGVVVINLSKGIELVDAGTADIYFKPDSPEITAAREAYLSSDDWKDKAGAYGIQDAGAAPLIDYFTGSYTAIMGLPTEILKDMLKSLGIEAHVSGHRSPLQKNV